jgi:hypothetical protein
MRTLLTALILLLSIFCFSCSNDRQGDTESQEIEAASKSNPPSTYTEDSLEGKPLIHNTGAMWENSPRLSLELVRTLGGPASSEADSTFFKPADISLDAQGNLYVLDAGNHRIKKIDPEGRLLAAFGKEGQGPGEFQFMDGIALDPQGRMYVSDRATRNVKILDAEGREIDTLPSPGPSGKLARLSEGDLVSLYTYGESPSLIQRFSPDGKAVARYGTFERHEDPDRSRYFNRVSFACGLDDSIFVAYATRNKIERYSASGDLLLTFDRPLNFPVSQEIRYEEHQFGPRKIKIPFVNFISGDMALDSSGRLWVISYLRQLEFEEMGLSIHYMDGDGRYEGSEPLKTSDRTEIDAFAFYVYDSGGHLLQTIPLNHHGGVVRIFEDCLYILEPRHDMCVYTYRIVSTPL